MQQHGDGHNHAYARLLVAARRLYEGHTVTQTWIQARFDVGVAAARRDIRWLRLYLPVDIVDSGRGCRHVVSLTIPNFRREVFFNQPRKEAEK